MFVSRERGTIMDIMVVYTTILSIRLTCQKVCGSYPDPDTRRHRQRAHAAVSVKIEICAVGGIVQRRERRPPFGQSILVGSRKVVTDSGVGVGGSQVGPCDLVIVQIAAEAGLKING